MSISIDEYAIGLLNKARRFNEKAKQTTDEVASTAFLQTAIIFAVMSLETTLFSISDELCLRNEISLLEKSLLLEKEIQFEDGIFSIAEKLKMSRLSDKVLFLLRRFHGRLDKENDVWWNNLKAGIHVRNELIHPKSIPSVTHALADNTILAVLKCIDVLYRTIYKKPYPNYSRSLTSNLDF